MGRALWGREKQHCQQYPLKIPACSNTPSTDYRIFGLAPVGMPFQIPSDSVCTREAPRHKISIVRAKSSPAFIRDYKTPPAPFGPFPRLKVRTCRFASTGLPPPPPASSYGFYSILSTLRVLLVDREEGRKEGLEYPTYLLVFSLHLPGFANAGVYVWTAYVYIRGERERGGSKGGI